MRGRPLTGLAKAISRISGFIILVVLHSSLPRRGFSLSSLLGDNDRDRATSGLPARFVLGFLFLIVSIASVISSSFVSCTSSSSTMVLPVPSVWLRWVSLLLSVVMITSTFCSGALGDGVLFDPNPLSFLFSSSLPLGGVA